MQAEAVRFLTAVLPELGAKYPRLIFGVQTVPPSLKMCIRDSLIHGLAQLGGQDAGAGHADEHVGSLDGFLQAALDLAGVGHLAQPCLLYTSRCV